MTTAASQDYRISPALAARLVGVCLALLAGVVFLATLLVAALRWPSWVLFAVAGAGVLVVAGLGIWMGRFAWAVRLNEEGYRVRFVRGAGVTRGRWQDVESAVTATRMGSACVVLRLRDGRTTTIPVEVLAADRDDFVRDLRSRLPDARGRRRRR